ncbi:uncharacterized protein H6S33_003993 [Morchella sextelata]|uniref:uncharacterized protein n=1 Tax=Morchella sextelata TaxID=1174677 RepID=UPI001D03C2D5|nr:uncharacterized protein H6S33_003993 [Morchella sextelata]KAH0606332.1 hypothetical protein H6S33_003993 [Morchella sextelata]
MEDFLEFNIVTYTLITVVLGLLVVPIFWQTDPDIHPLILHRQSNVAPIRNPKESAVHRSNNVPSNQPFVTGLNLPTEQKFQIRDGDIRDIWKLAIEKGNGKMLSVRGADVHEIDMVDLTANIHSLGSHLASIPGAKRIAIYLANDIENIVATFACAFYDLHLLILPFDPTASSASVNALLKRSELDVLIAPAGQLPLKDVEGVNLKQLIYVVERGSQHLDFNSPPGSAIKTAIYHEIIKTPGSPPPSGPIDLKAPSVITFATNFIGNDKKIEITPFNHRNIIAGVASAIHALPKNEQLTKNDVFIPVDTLSDLYTRINTYAALASGATLALNPVSGSSADFEKCVARVRPTVVVASPNTLDEVHRKTMGSQMEMWHGIIHYFQSRTLTVHGSIPKGNFWTRVNDYARPSAGDPSRLRLILTAESAGDLESKPLNSEDLSDLRVFFGCKVVYGLKYYLVAGPICQTHIYDYRVQTQIPKPSRKKGVLKRCAHFGPVAPGCEVVTRDYQEYSAADEGGSRGEIVVRGLTVSGAGSGGKGEVKLGVVGKWWPEGVLSYV